MGETTGIGWTDGTWNPWQGCTKVSEACDHCYMFRDLLRFGRDGSIVVRSKEPTFNLPLKLNREGTYKLPNGSKVFTCSWSDFFHPKADEWRDEAWRIIYDRPGLTFQIVTKRTSRMQRCLPADWGEGYPNVWLIATVENQDWLEMRTPELLATPAAIHGLSIEPMLGPIDMTRYLPAIDWVITGGESGAEARPTHPQWVRSIRDQCEDALIPFFHKQWGDWLPLEGGLVDVMQSRNNETRPTRRIDLQGRDISDQPGLWDDTDAMIGKVGTKAAGNLIDGRKWEDFPTSRKATV